MAEAATAAAAAVATPAEEVASSVARTIEKTKSDPRFTRGIALLKEKRLEEAVAIFEDMLRTMIEVEQESESLAVAPLYYEYGHALLSLAEATASVFGNAGAADEDGGAEGDVEQEARETADDLQVAWEMLEIARVIYTRFPEELAVEKELARVYVRLGDLGMESEVFDQAKSDYEKSLMLRKKILKATNDPDTTLLADLYCCLAISCIYQDTAAKPDENNAPDKIQASMSLEEQGMKFYVLAGRVMGENIYRVAQTGPPQLLDFVQQRIPKYSSDEDAGSSAETPGKGKGKKKAATSVLELEYKLDNITSLREDFLTCVQVYKSMAGESGPAGSTTEENLSKDEAQLLEYIEIYVELKEKVDGIKESVQMGGFGRPNEGQVADAADGAVTTIGFGESVPTPAAAESLAPTTVAAPAAAAAPVNMLPVVKKRKITPQAVETTMEKESK